MDINAPEEQFSWEEESIMDFEDFIPRHKSEIHTGLSNNDYNLDSPLLRDVLDETMRCWVKNGDPIHHEIKVKANLKSLHEMNSLFKKELLGPQFFHKMLVKKWLRPQSEKKFMSSKVFLENTKEMSLAMMPVLGPFYKKVFLNVKFGESLKSVSVATSDNHVLHLFQLYVELHLLVLSANCNRKNMEKLVNLSKVNRWDLFNVSIKLDNSENDTILITAPILGEIAINNTLIISLNTGHIMDKNLILMAKDVCIGRLMTLINLYISRMKLSIEVFKNIMNAGDIIIEDIGSKAYDFLKMLEPMCVQRWLNLAGRTEFDHESRNKYLGHIREEISTSIPKHRVLLEYIMEQINRLGNPDEVGSIFGSFRLWGHPFIMYEEGLVKIKKQCRLEKVIDEEYAELLADDLAFMIIKDFFKKNNKWPIEQPSKEHILYKYVKNNTWPNKKFLNQKQIKWSKLGLQKIFDIPEDIHISQLYSDKSFSMQRDEVISVISSKSKSKNPIPTKRVIAELLNRDTLNPKEFAENINEKGLDLNDLVIGLKEKERELKGAGRFFTLMSWKLREYIVLTEYLIKTKIMKMFDGITMADGFSTVTKKMINVTKGQSNPRGDLITYANHIDYTKWNNHQRPEAVNPVFRVMGECFGLPELFTKTHEFFNNSLIYYVGRPDLIKLKHHPEKGLVVDEDKTSVAWNGHPGGFEGVRQKGWTIVGMLCLMRESKRRQTSIKYLAQGDNQVIFTEYKLLKGVDKKVQEKSIAMNNVAIMDNIFAGSKRMGLLINGDETYTSSGFTIYGKIPTIFGNVINLETKKWNRVTCVSNDQIPTSMNLMGILASTAIGSCQMSSNIFLTLEKFVYFGTMLFNMCDQFNVLLTETLKYSDEKHKEMALIKWLFLDRSLGGYTGMSPTRLLIRSFPDPITEGLSFWKNLADNSTSWLHDLAVHFMNPKILSTNKNWVDLLSENPVGLNVYSGVIVENLLKTEIKKNLSESRTKIKNKIIRGALDSDKVHRSNLTTFLESIQPVFPRFLAEFKASSIIGTIDGVIGLVQNSRTMRDLFKEGFSKKVQDIVYFQEGMLQKFLTDKTIPRGTPVTCSATHADILRYRSWRMKVIGATVPHPYEFLETNSERSLDMSLSAFEVCIPKQLPSLSEIFDFTGPMEPYLGSKTSESTSFTQSWEVEVKNSLSKKAYELLRVLGWFVKFDSKLGRSVIRNAQYMTKQQLEIVREIISRTGSALHRLSTERQSNGGSTSINPNYLRWCFVGAENWEYGRKENYDFMYQACLIYCQTLAIHNDLSGVSIKRTRRFVLGCPCCMRKIDDVFLESDSEYYPDITNSNPAILSEIKPFLKSVTKKVINLQEIDSDLIREMTESTISYWVGFNQSIGWGLNIKFSIDSDLDASIFPIGAMKKVEPKDFFIGWIDGLRLVASLELIRRDIHTEHFLSSIIFRGNWMGLISQLSNADHALHAFQIDKLRDELISIVGSLPASFPTTRYDMQSLLSKGMYLLGNKRSLNETNKTLSKILITSELNTGSFLKYLIIGLDLLKNVVIDSEIYHKLNKSDKLKIIKTSINIMTEGENFSKLISSRIEALKVKLFKTNSELRHLAGTDGIENDNNRKDGLKFGEEAYLKECRIRIICDENEDSLIPEYREGLNSGLHAGLRSLQFATGAHYKLRSIIKDNAGLNSMLNTKDSIVLCIGDGSGGISAMILRSYPNSKVIFNSLIEMKDSTTNGMVPQPPSAISSLQGNYYERCLNYNNFWIYNTDLTKSETWRGFKEILKGRKVDLVICDAEVSDLKDTSLITGNLIDHCDILEKGCYIIYKSFSMSLYSLKKLYSVSNSFRELYGIRSMFASSFSSEIYIILGDMVDKMIKKDKLNISNSSFCTIERYINNKTQTENEILRAKILFLVDRWKGVPLKFKENSSMELNFLLSDMGLMIVDRSRFYNNLVNIYKMSRIEVNKLLYNLEIKVLGYNKKVQEFEFSSIIPGTSKIIQFIELKIAIYLLKGLIGNEDDLIKYAINLENKYWKFLLPYKKDKSGLIMLSKNDSLLYYKNLIVDIGTSIRRDHVARAFRILESLNHL